MEAWELVSRMASGRVAEGGGEAPGKWGLRAAQGMEREGAEAAGKPGGTDALSRVGGPQETQARA